MNDRIAIKLYNAKQAHKAIMEIWQHIKPWLVAGDKFTLKIEPETRSVEQNSRMWSMLADLAAQIDWYGQKLSSEDWKHVLTACLKGQKTVPGIESGFVVLGYSTSKMSVKEMTDLMDLIEAFGAQQNVKFKSSLE